MLFQNWTSPLYWISLFGIFLYIYYTIYGNDFQLELVTILNCFMCAKGQKRTAEAVLRVPENCRMVRPTNATNGGRPQVAPTQKRFVRCCPNLQNNISEVLVWISHIFAATPAVNTDTKSIRNTFVALLMLSSSCNSVTLFLQPFSLGLLYYNLALIASGLWKNTAFYKNICKNQSIVL